MQAACSSMGNLFFTSGAWQGLISKAFSRAFAIIHATVPVHTGHPPS